MIKVSGNYRWCVEADYDEDRDCVSNGCDSICRCRTITNIEITEVSEPYITIKEDSGKNGRWVNYKPSDIELYCIDRIKVYTGVYDIDNWSIRAVRDYYGDELGDGTFANDDVLENRIKEMIEMGNELDKVLYVLNLEYNFTADTIKDCNTAEVITVDKKGVITRFNEDGFVRKSDTKYPREIDTKIPVCVVREELKLVDGNNRMLDVLHNYPDKKIKVIKLWKK